MLRYTLKVYPAGAGRQIYRVIEIDGKESLKKLCSVILTAYDFTDEHLYEFCMDNRMYSDYSYQSDPERGQRSAKIRIDQLDLIKGQNFLLHYDFGDDWMFTIHVQKMVETETTAKPSAIKEMGEVEQYPDYEDEYDEEDPDDYEQMSLEIPEAESESSSVHHRPDQEKDNVRVYIPLDINREAMTRRLQTIVKG